MDPIDAQTLGSAKAAIERAEDELRRARVGLIETVLALLRKGYSQAEIARALGVTRATLNQKILAHVRGRSKASRAHRARQGTA